MKRFVIRSAPPPPPPPRSRSRRRTALVSATILIAIIVVANLFVFNVIQWPFNPKPPVANEEIVVTKGSLTQATSKALGASGGTVEVTDASNPLNGLKIEVPETAADETINFTVKYATVTSISGLPQNASVASTLISIETSGSDAWNKYKTFNLPTTVTLPYDPNLITPDCPVRFYSYDEQSKNLESAGFLWENPANHTVTFQTATFSSWLAILLNIPTEHLLEVLSETGFRPKNDGWYIPNLRSYLGGEGNCLGMSGYAAWYYAYKKVATGVDLYRKYIEGDPNQWRDDATAIQLASRAQIMVEEISRGSLSLQVNAPVGSKLKSPYVAVTWLHGLITTRHPQLVNFKRQLANGKYDLLHVGLIYRYENGRFDVYDPNYSGTEPGTDDRQIPFNLTEGGFTRPYVSGEVEFNVFMAVGSKTFFSYVDFSGLYGSAEKKFKDDTLFPAVKLTDSSTDPVGTTPVDKDSDGTRETQETQATISGTIKGGMKDVTSSLIFISGRKYRIPVTDGAFSKTVDLYQGVNEVIVLATDEDTRSYWAGYLKDTINCTASKALLTFTLTWEQDESDVDLHVLEPTIDGEEGRHIYFGNKGLYTSNDNPYLDIDNTKGYGPEHYIAAERMTLPNYNGPGKSIYGTYKVRVHYYSDHDDDQDETRHIIWHLNIKYLAFRNELTRKEFWVEGDWSGLLESADTASTSDFFNPDPSWGEIYTVDYPQPDPNDYNVPPPPQNNLPY